MNILGILIVFLQSFSSFAFKTRNLNLTSILLTEPRLQTFTKGSQIQLECPTESTNNKLDFVIQWYKNQRKLNLFLNSETTNKRTKIQQNKLSFAALYKIDSGVYNCEVIYGNGQIFKSHSITLEFIGLDSNEVEIQTKQNKKSTRGERPQFINILRNNQSIYKFEKSKVELDCQSTGSPKPQVLWYKNEQLISEEQLGFVSNSMILKLKDLEQSDSAIYQCQVFNQVGEINRTFNLQIVKREKLYKAVKLNETILIQCPIQQNTSQNIKWYAKLYNVQDLQTQSQIKLENQQFSLLDLTKLDYPLIPSDLFLNTNFKSQILSLNLINSNLANMYQLNDGSLLINKADLSYNGEYICINEFNQIFTKRIELNVIQYMQSSTVKQNFLKQTSNRNFNNIPLIVISFLAIFSFVLIISLSCYYLIKLKKSNQTNLNNPNLAKNLASKMNRYNSVQVLNHYEPNHFKTRRYSVVVPGSNLTNQTCKSSTIYRSQVQSAVYPVAYFQQLYQQQPQFPIRYQPNDVEVIHIQQQQPSFLQSTRLNTPSARSSINSSSKSSNKH